MNQDIWTGIFIGSGLWAMTALIVFGYAELTRRRGPKVDQADYFNHCNDCTVPKAQVIRPMDEVTIEEIQAAIAEDRCAIPPGTMLEVTKDQKVRIGDTGSLAFSLPLDTTDAIDFFIAGYQ